MLFWVISCITIKLIKCSIIRINVRVFTWLFMEAYPSIREFFNIFLSLFVNSSEIEPLVSPVTGHQLGMLDTPPAFAVANNLRNLICWFLNGYEIKVTTLCSSIWVWRAGVVVFPPSQIVLLTRISQMLIAESIPTPPTIIALAAQ